MRKQTIQFQVPKFAAYTEPHGKLNNSRECQALFYYYILAVTNWKREQTELVLEGDPDVEANYERLFKNAAQMYHANIETMANFWPLVDAEIDRQSVVNVLQHGGKALSHLPEKLKFKNTVIAVRDKGKMN